MQAGCFPAFRAASDAGGPCCGNVQGRCRSGQRHRIRREWGLPGWPKVLCTGAGLRVRGFCRIRPDGVCIDHRRWYILCDLSAGWRLQSLPVFQYLLPVGVQHVTGEEVYASVQDQAVMFQMEIEARILQFSCRCLATRECRERFCMAICPVRSGCHGRCGRWIRSRSGADRR